jgi:hypothetical protein
MKPSQILAVIGLAAACLSPASAQNSITLPQPLYFENFDSTEEGKLPAGWTSESYSVIDNAEFDLGDLNSASYANWIVVDGARFKGSFITYSNPDNPQDWEDDYRRVLSFNPANVVNGVVVSNLVEGKFAFGDSGYRNGGNQVLYMFTPDFDLTGKTDVYVSFHSIYEQNQDSIGAVEYSIDGGTNWLPIVYMLDVPDVVRDGTGKIDAVATLTSEHDDVAHYTDPTTGEDKGGTYGSFIAASISQDLAPYISPRVDDNAVESKRVELFRLPAADGKPKVRFRFAYAGTDSWYFGVDDFGLYSISIPRVSLLTPSTGAARVSPSVVVSATILDGAVQVVTNSIELSFDGVKVAPSIAKTGITNFITYDPPGLLASGSAHDFRLVFSDNGTPSSVVTNLVQFTVKDYPDVTLPAPLYQETFDSVPEGELPQGWTVANFTTDLTPGLDLNDITSDSYKDWVVIDRQRLTDITAWETNRFLYVAPDQYVNGVLVTNLIEGHFILANSGYRGRNEILYLFTKDFDLSGKSNIYLYYHSIFEQNQDSLGAVEYSTDGGVTWLPIVYMLDGVDVVRDGSGNVDVPATFNTTRDDIATYTDPATGEDKGGTYGSFIGAPITPALAPFISVRINDDPIESKRVEFFRLPQADNQSKVRFRFAHAGTDSWYFGIDNFGLYSLQTTDALRITGITRNGNNITISWSGGPGIKLQKASSLSNPTWQDVAGSDGASSVSEPVTTSNAFYRLTKP